MTTNKKTVSKKLRPVLVTTAHRGVFFGYTDKTDGLTVVLRRARNCVSWSADVQGFIGLATKGPSASCKIGPAAEELEVRAVTSVAVCSEDAAAAWERAPWK